MGFLSAASFSVKSKYGSVPSSFAYGKISCSGDESSLNECSQSDETIIVGQIFLEQYYVVWDFKNYLLDIVLNNPNNFYHDIN